MQQPPLLKPGDTIGITSTARKISVGEIKFALKTLGEWGFNVVLADCIGKEDNQFAGNDEMRANSFQRLLDDNSVKAILCARGGYGTVRVLEHLNWEKFKTQPKWICGYSDVTVLHSFIHEQLGVQSLHSTMPINFEKNTSDSLSSLKNSLLGDFKEYCIESNNLNKTGSAKGELIGGNLSILYSLLGSDAQINTTNKILFIEDLDEYLYHIDRMMMAIKRAGMLDHLSGLIIGGMSDMNDNAIPFGKTAEQIIHEHTEKFDFPIAFNFPAGHIDNNLTLPLGKEYYLEVTHTETILTPIAPKNEPKAKNRKMG